MTDLDLLLAHLREITDPDKVAAYPSALEANGPDCPDLEAWADQARELIARVETEIATTVDTLGPGLGGGPCRLTLQCDGETRTFLGKLTAIEQIVDTLDRAIPGEDFVGTLRPGTGEVRVSFRYVNSPRD